MKKTIRIGLTLAAIGFAIFVIFSIYWPFAIGVINQKRTVGDATMHVANITAFQRDHPFPIMTWKPEWAGYPMVEGYPWLHYYLIQPFISHFSSVGVAMDYYMAVFLLIYYLTAFLLLFHVSRNVFLALLFSLVLFYGADSQMPFSVDAFMTFTSSQFFLPLILFITIFAREKNSLKLFLISAILLAVSFYSHGAMTGIVIVPVILSFLILNNVGKISKESIVNTVRYFIVFALVSSIQIYQFISYNSQGYLRGVKPFPLDVIPSRLVRLFTWVNPVLLPILIISIPLLILAIRKNFSVIKPYLLSLFLISFVFALMVFNITSMNLVLLAERILWGLSLIFLLLFSKAIKILARADFKKLIAVSLFSSLGIGVYLYLTLVVKLPHLVPDAQRGSDQYKYNVSAKEEAEIKQNLAGLAKYKTKYDFVYSYPPLSWSKSFDNYRTDGLSYSIYSNWNIWSANPRYKGRFPAAKGLPLDWSGLVTAAGYGNLGEAGATDSSNWAINQTVFFFDWYGIKHFEKKDIDLELADYLKKKPLITSAEDSLNLTYYNIDQKYIGPMYEPTNVPTIAVVSPEKQYDNFIRTLSYSDFTSKRAIPIYLGPSLGSLTKENLQYFDAVFIYGYTKPLFSLNQWVDLTEYVRNGGKLIIETGQKVDETESSTLPEVFPVKATGMAVVSQPWNLNAQENNLTKNINKADFQPLKTKYLPYAISQAQPESLKDWAKPVLTNKDGSIIMAYGQFGKGSVAWSGLNLPFHAIDNRNTSETVIFANILDWFFPKIEAPISDFQVSHPKPEQIIVKSTKGKGVLLKENIDPGWHATLNGKSVKIFNAGLFEMYIPLFSNKGEYVVELNYLGTPIYWVLFFVSLISLIGIFIYLFFNKNPLLLVTKFIQLDKKAEEENY